jgi:cell division protein ZapA
MAHVTVRINGRAYQVACEDGQEPHLEKLAAYIDQRVAELVRDVGQVGDARLLVMTSLIISDELADAYDELEELRDVNTVPMPPDPDTVRAAEAARNAASAAEARVATAEQALQVAQERIAKLEQQLAGTAAPDEALQDEFAAGLEALATRVTALAERIERERA